MATNKNLKEKILTLRKDGYKMTDIASMLKCNLANVKYHCGRNGLTGYYRNKKISKDTFEQIKILLEKGLNQKEISDTLKISISTIKRYKDKPFEEFVDRRDYLTSYMVDKRKELKLKAIEYKGGCCSICGYNKSVLSLSFHHVEPNMKDFNISGVTRTWEKIRKELDKCILVCNNCHGEIHEKENKMGL